MPRYQVAVWSVYTLPDRLLCVAEARRRSVESGDQLVPYRCRIGRIAAKQCETGHDAVGVLPFGSGAIEHARDGKWGGHRDGRERGRRS